MTPNRLRECLAALNWTQRGLARALHVDERQVRRWVTGAAVPESVAGWLERRAKAMAADPPPRRQAP